MTVAVWFGCAGSAAAETKTWVGGGGTWDTPANWSPAGVPSATDDAVIASGTPNVSAADATVGSIDVSSGLQVSGDRRLTVSGPAPSTIATNVVLSHGTLRLDGVTTWSSGSVQLWDAGVVENAGVLVVPAGAGVSLDIVDNGGAVGARVLRVLAGGVVEAAGSLLVGSEVENDGTLRVLAGGSLVQSGGVASPADSGGAFVAQGSGVLSLSNVVMGAASSASGTGTIRFAGGLSRVVAGAGYAAGITEIGGAGELDFDDAGSSGALRFSGVGGTRRGDGTLTVGGGQSQLGSGIFTEAGVTAFSSNSQVAINSDVVLSAPAAGHRLRLDGVTTWSSGSVQLWDAGVVENAGVLRGSGGGRGEFGHC